jgi:FixJ family two-component response regulator
MFEKLLSPSRGPSSSESDPPQVRPRRRIRSVNLDKILNGLKTLTPREHEVLSQVVSGRRNREIASELGITIRTVKEHRGRVMEKMEANSLAELVTMIVTARLNETRMTTQATEGTP